MLHYRKLQPFKRFWKLRPLWTFCNSNRIRNTKADSSTKTHQSITV